MPRKDRVLVLPGMRDTASQLLRPATDEFGWSVEVVADPREIPVLEDRHRIVAVLFQRDAFGAETNWTEALSQLKSVLPDARLVPCLKFSEAVDLDHLTDAGAFHFLWMPWKESELRQCIGFLWQNTRSLPAGILQPMPVERARKSPRSVEYSAA